MRKNLRKLIPYIIISIILIMSLIKVYADYMYQSSDVEYDNSNSELEATDVQSAIDELYEKASACASSNNDCPDGYTKNMLNEYQFVCSPCESGYSFQSTTNGYRCLDTSKICHRAATLHTETCNNSSSSGSYCTASYSIGDTVTYGSLGTVGNEPSPSDAFDCDVNGDGTYDSETERFYYVSKYYDTSSKSFDDNYYTFIYYSDVVNGVATPYSTVTWHSTNSTSYGPTTAIVQLPTTSGDIAWRDDLLKTTTRNILKGTSVTSVTSTAKSNFSYSGYAARLLTMQELKSACPNASTSTGSMNNCQYFFENTKYTDSTKSSYGPWLETAYDSNNAWFVYSNGRIVSYINIWSSGYGGARPAIEIPKTQVSY